MSEYDGDYLSWKAWDIESFAKYSSAQERYFDQLIQMAGLSRAEGLNVLEIGFGNGQFMAYARDRQWGIKGTEVNPSLVGIAIKKSFDVVESANLEEFVDEQFDLIVALDVLEHIEKDQLQKLVSKIYSLLNKDGVFISRFPNGDSPFSLVYQNGDITHLNHIGSLQCSYMIDKLGANRIYVGGEPAVNQNAFKVIAYLRVIVSKLVQRMINFVVRVVFYGKYDFCSKNLVMIFSK